MKNLIKIIIVMPILLALLLTGCTLDAPSDPTGKVNASGPDDATSQFVAIGNSLTAGFMDSGLMQTGQANSFPMLVATQMGLNTDSFTQPWVKSPGIGTTDLHDDSIVSGVLHYNGVSPVPLGTTPKDQVISDLLLAVAQPTPYHNLGVPGARVNELMNTHNGATSFGAAFGDTNSFFDFINRSSFFDNIHVPPSPPSPAFETASQFGQGIAKGGALSSVFIGGNDFLFGAVSGEPIGHPAITDPTAWGASYGAFLGTYAGGLMQRNGFKSDIVVITLPMVEHIPYFLDIDDFTPVFGPWDTAESNVEYVLITDFLAWFMDNPGGELPEEMTLDDNETVYLNTIIGGYNTYIQGTILSETVAPLANFGFVDINTALAALDDENTQHFLYLRAIHGDEAFAATAARTYFSLDGVHPNNKGYAFLANEFLDVVNDLRDTNYPLIPLAAITWDPTYGVPAPEPAKSGQNSWPTVSPEVAQGFKELWR
jgi:GDSL-like Lipase/Acylhydrolase